MYIYLSIYLYVYVCMYTFTYTYTYTYVPQCPPNSTRQDTRPCGIAAHNVQQTALRHAALRQAALQRRHAGTVPAGAHLVDCEGHTAADRLTDIRQ